MNLSKITLLVAFAVNAESCFVNLCLANDNRTNEHIRQLLASLREAVDARAFETAELHSARLSKEGTNALPIIKAALANANPQERKSLITSLAGMSGDAASETLVDIAVNDSEEEVSWIAVAALEKRSIPRALTSAELKRATMRLQNSETVKAWRWASLIARVRGDSNSDAVARVSAILDRYSADVNSPPTNSFIKGSYLSADAFRLNGYLIILPHIDSSVSIPVVQKRHADATESIARKWLLFARGMCRDRKISRELKEFVLNESRDASERALALRAYAMAEGTNAVPLLERFTDNQEIGYVPGLPPAEPRNRNVGRPLQMIARDELVLLKNPELRVRFRGH
jgi:hypothetical protein